MIKKITFICIIIFFLHSTQTCSAYDLDVVSTVTSVIDGDSFYIQGDEVRFADVSCPEWNEYGGSEATQALTGLIEGKIVYLDTDQQSGRGPYGRLIAVVYIVYNETHFLNVNEYMVFFGHAELTDYTNNEFDPYTWTPLVRYAYVESETPESLSEELAILNDNYDQLNASFQILYDEHIVLLDEYNELNTAYVELETAYDELLEAQSSGLDIPGFPLMSIVTGLSFLFLLRKTKHG